MKRYRKREVKPVYVDRRIHCAMASVQIWVYARGRNVISRHGERNSGTGEDKQRC